MSQQDLKGTVSPANSDTDSWKEALDSEYKALQESSTFSVVAVRDITLLPKSSWLFTKSSKYCSRMVRGNMQ